MNVQDLLEQGHHASSSVAARQYEQMHKPWSLPSRLIFALGFLLRAYALFLRYFTKTTAPPPLETAGAPAGGNSRLLFGLDFGQFLMVFIAWTLIGQNRLQLCKYGHWIAWYMVADAVFWMTSLYMDEAPSHLAILYIPLNLLGLVIFVKRQKMQKLDLI